MIKLGLTGSIGMGKSTTAQIFADKDVPVYDADAVVHQLYQSEAVPLIAEAFPEAVIDGQVDRKILSASVLGKPDELKKLENIVHPLVHAKEQQFLRDAEAKGAKLVVLDIPLLFETGGTNRVDKILVVSAPYEMQRERVLSRENMTEEKFQSILARQMPDAEKRAKADFIVDTGQDKEFARQQVSEILEKLLNTAL
ncbi:dephospho-CoA kinase [Pseudochrobactrum algeriensis]|uniref:dephospho-CoA kinase n=1 Tax=Pseudochrobactrum algeriensis TaxID=2834768 RepID=UPI001BCC0FB0|nr:dephospho-CoA kinase [Pseudochrobactrum algeriensis]MBX8813666.1 dephospho-CoA kinase [Ochrobactrum sp. MR34]QVQ36776.1 dephospho-CoA kinase [Pseudochrobactrum algeriensis]QVQ39992.1 dephospho-CoA kinase [Pseudochrobactrum algeriensis]QVQ43915.1 dephospho-CoA kinase [Pseudochrobactrum algeriensis]